MSTELSEIPGSFPDILSAAVVTDVNQALADYKQSNDPNILEKYERDFTSQLKAAQPGDDFLGQRVTRVDAASDTATIQVRISGRDVPFVPGLKLGLATAQLEIARRVNLTDIAPDRPPIEVKSIPSFAVEIELSKKDNYEVRLGYSRDDSVTNQSQMALVSVKWESPKFSLLGSNSCMSSKCNGPARSTTNFTGLPSRSAGGRATKGHVQRSRIPAGGSALTGRSPKLLESIHAEAWRRKSGAQRAADGSSQRM